ncbi:hypothetical protein MHYP_G00077800 [Metynnis hypsauchen]
MIGSYSNSPIVILKALSVKALLASFKAAYLFSQDGTRHKRLTYAFKCLRNVKHSPPCAPSRSPRSLTLSSLTANCTLPATEAEAHVTHWRRCELPLL